MSRLSSSALCICIVVFLTLVCCQKDNYEQPELKPKTYSFNIPNKLSFNFSQLSENRESIIPYGNTLVLKNISANDFSGEYTVFAFKGMELNYSNLAFLKHGEFEEIQANSVSDSIVLESSDNLFTDDNLIASILNFNNSFSNHNLNGFFIGELNILIPAVDETSDPSFLRSITCVGTVDYQGKFYFFTQDGNEQDVVRLEGNFNSENLVSGTIFNSSNTILSPMSNIADEDIQLIDGNLSGNVMISINNEERLLHFNLTKQD